MPVSRSASQTSKTSGKGASGDTTAQKSDGSDDDYSDTYESDTEPTTTLSPTPPKTNGVAKNGIEKKKTATSKRNTTITVNGVYATNKGSSMHRKRGGGTLRSTNSSMSPAASGTARGDSTNVTKRVLSASRMKINDLRNQVSSLSKECKELQQENRLLKRIEQRQMRALERFENAEDEIPQMLLQHHNEERALKELYRKSQERNQKNEARLRDKDREIELIKGKIQKLEDMGKRKDLPEKDELAKRMDRLESQIEERNKRVSELQRSIQLQEKKHKHQIQIEFARHRDTQNKLKQLEEIRDSLERKLTEKDKELNMRAMYHGKIVKPPHKLNSTPSPASSGKKKRGHDDVTARSDHVSTSADTSPRIGQRTKSQGLPFLSAPVKPPTYARPGVKAALSVPERSYSARYKSEVTALPHIARAKEPQSARDTRETQTMHFPPYERATPPSNYTSRSQRGSHDRGSLAVVSDARRTPTRLNSIAKTSPGAAAAPATLQRKRSSLESCKTPAVAADATSRRSNVESRKTPVDASGSNNNNNNNNRKTPIDDGRTSSKHGRIEDRRGSQPTDKQTRDSSRRITFEAEVARHSKKSKSKKPRRSHASVSRSSASSRRGSLMSTSSGRVAYRKSTSAVVAAYNAASASRKASQTGKRVSASAAGAVSNTVNKTGSSNKAFSKQTSSSTRTSASSSRQTTTTTSSSTTRASGAASRRKSSRKSDTSSKLKEDELMAKLKQEQQEREEERKKLEQKRKEEEDEARRRHEAEERRKKDALLAKMREIDESRHSGAYRSGTSVTAATDTSTQQSSGVSNQKSVQHQRKQKLMKKLFSEDSAASSPHSNAGTPARRASPSDTRKTYNAANFQNNKNRGGRDSPEVKFGGYAPTIQKSDRKVTTTTTTTTASTTDNSRRTQEYSSYATTVGSHPAAQSKSNEEGGGEESDESSSSDDDSSSSSSDSESGSRTYRADQAGGRQSMYSGNNTHMTESYVSGQTNDSFFPHIAADQKGIFPQPQITPVKKPVTHYEFDDDLEEMTLE